MTRTNHGHHIEGTTFDDEVVPMQVARCGGPALCLTCRTGALKFPAYAAKFPPVEKTDAVMVLAENYHGLDVGPHVNVVNVISTTGNEIDPNGVDHPAHYNLDPSGVECIEITRWLNFNVGNAFKYLFRAGLKDATLKDLNKAIWYLQDEITNKPTYWGTRQSKHIEPFEKVIASRSGIIRQAFIDLYRNDLENAVVSVTAEVERLSN